ncbi:hypothetical protein ACEPAI_1681 [Sanghuangporus weigelae]
MLQLNCLSLDEPSYGHFSVCVDPSTKLSKVKRSIYERLDSFYNSCRLDIPDLGLYLPSGLMIEPIDSLVERAKIVLQSSRHLPEFDKLSNFFPHEPDRRHIHILIHTAEIIKKRKRPIIDDPVEIRHAKTLGLARYALCAAEAALPDRLPSEQSKYPIYNGRSDSCRGPPITIYNKAFAELKDALEDVSNIGVTAQELKAAHMFLTMSIKFYHYEGDRMEQTDLELEKLLGYSITNAAPGDSLVKAYLHEQRVILACLGWRNELGSEGDAGYHAACSYRQYVTDTEYEEVRKRTCSPTIIVGIMGPYLCLMGGIFVDEIIVQPFTDYLFLGGDPDYGKRVLHIARVFKATKRALRELERYYEACLGDDSSCRPHLPQPSVVDESNPCPNLRFVDRLFPENMEQEANTNELLWVPNRSSGDHASNDECPMIKVNGRDVYTRLRAVLIDFDWCGKDSEARYPTTLNDTGDIDWAPGVERFGLMKKEHDDYCLRNLASSELQQANGYL